VAKCCTCLVGAVPTASERPSDTAVEVYYMKQKIVFIINPISGTSDKMTVLKQIEAHLDHDKHDYQIATTEYPGQAYEIAVRAKDEDCDMVVAVGGDGTVNEVARALIYSDTALGILPCGSGNGLARHLLIPMNIKKAIEIINVADVRALDFGIINNHPFFCTCGMGFDAYISMKFAESRKRGPITYAENILREGLKYKPEKYVVEDEQGTNTYKAFLVSCANASQYGNNAYIAPQASMSDGKMDVIIIPPLDVVEAPQVSIDMFNKTLDKNPKIKTFQSQRLHIRREKAGLIHVDGDPIMTDCDVDVQIEAGGIRMVVNPFADKNVRKPNAIQNAMSDFFNELNAMREDFSKQGKIIQEHRKGIRKKLNL